MSNKPSWPWQDRLKNGWALLLSTTSQRCRLVRAKVSSPVPLAAAAEWDGCFFYFAFLDLILLCNGPVWRGVCIMNTIFLVLMCGWSNRLFNRLVEYIFWLSHWSPPRHHESGGDRFDECFLWFVPTRSSMPSRPFSRWPRFSHISISVPCFF